MQKKKTLATQKPPAKTPTGAFLLITIVELRGLEPPTFRMRTERSPIELQPPASFKSTKETRTDAQDFSQTTFAIEYRKKRGESQSLTPGEF
jgi:hypothetical protein